MKSPKQFPHLKLGVNKIAVSQQLKDSLYAMLAAVGPQLGKEPRPISLGKVLYEIALGIWQNFNPDSHQEN